MTYLTVALSTYEENKLYLLLTLYLGHLHSQPQPLPANPLQSAYYIFVSPTILARAPFRFLL